MLIFDILKQVLQNFMFAMLKDSNITAAKMSLVCDLSIEIES